MKSFLDLVNDCDSFPNASTHPLEHSTRLSTLTLFKLEGLDPAVGYLLPSIVTVLKQPDLSGPHWSFSSSPPTATLHGTTPSARSANILTTISTWREKSIFAVLAGWRDELYAMYAPRGTLALRLERSATPLFGVITYGVHMTAYLPGASPGDMRIWVPRRARDKQTYPGLLDNTVAGGIPAGEDPFESLVRECAEEASLPEDLARRARSVGTVTYFYEREGRAGGETGLLQPECQYVYDLALEEGVECRPCDSEVQEFYLWGVGEVVEAMRRGEFKPNCAVVLLDFLVRHGVVTPEGEGDYIEIVARLHRRLEFPTA